jgi:hypothetical protein
MPDSKPDRATKRKSRDGPDEPPRKKQHRAPPADDVQFEDYGSGDDVPAKSSRKYKDKFAPRPERQYPSVNELKKRIRDVKRLLQKPKLPADARIVQERALAGYEQDLAEENARRERSQMIKKYHFVRFLGTSRKLSLVKLRVANSALRPDRKNATKHLNRLERRQKEQTLDSKQKKHLESKIHAARVNLNYTIYYPLTEKYIALYPKSKTSDKDGADSGSESEAEQKTRDDEEKPPIWSVVEKCMEEGTLGQLRDGKLNIGADGKQTAPPSAKAGADTVSKKGKKESKELKDSKSQKPRSTDDKSKYDNFTRKDRRREQAKEQAKMPAPVQTDGDESDGGFFE